MKKAILACILGASLCSCSLLQRHEAKPDEEAESEEADADPEAPLFRPDGQEDATAGQEAEISRLNTKVAALETKLDVLSAGMERLQARQSQPVIEAEVPPQATLAAPVGDGEVAEQARAVHVNVSAAPARPPQLPPAAKMSPAEAPQARSGAEKEFRAAMELYQNGQHLEAASRFALMARQYPQHLLAGHALYWAGEASSRAQQWSLAIENWSELEKRYPRSAYLPEALSGLAKAHESQGDATKGRYYRTVLLRAFPKSPVAMHSGSEPTRASVAESEGPTPGKAPGLGAPQEDPVPVFEEDEESGKSGDSR